MLFSLRLARVKNVFVLNVLSFWISYRYSIYDSLIINILLHISLKKCLKINWYKNAVCSNVSLNAPCNDSQLFIVLHRLSPKWWDHSLGWNTLFSRNTIVPKLWLPSSSRTMIFWMKNEKRKSNLCRSE